MYNIVDYGAKTGGEIVNTAAIQAAIDACANEGGGQVVIPRGEFLCGGLTLKSHVTLYLEPGAVLKASAKREDYQENLPGFRKGILIYATDAEDIAIDGGGIILGTGQEDFGGWWGIPGPLEYRVSLLLVERCNNVRILNVTFLYSDSWTLHFRLCENVRVIGSRILNNFYHLNSDGIDPDSCKNVIISDCHIIAGDDCIVPKTTVENAPMENLVVNNCIMESPATAVKIGTESKSDFRDIHFNNCTIRNSSVGLGIFVKDGALVERVSFTNMSVECANREHMKPVIPLYIDIEKREENSPIGHVRDVIFQNIQVKSGSGALFQGMPESKIENLTLSDISFRADFAADFPKRIKAFGCGRTSNPDGRDRRFISKPAYISCAHIDGLFCHNINVIQEGDAGKLDMSAMYLYDVNDADINHVRQKSSGVHTAPLILKEE